MIDEQRTLESHTVVELARMSPLALAELAMRAEEESAAVWAEHSDELGEVPPEVEERARHLSRLSEFFARLAGQAGGH